MKAARLVGPKLFEFLDVDMPVADDGQVLIKLERVSVCGSDCRHGFNIHIQEFKFVGSTICYAYMQATGMVNDHVVDCFRYKQV